MKLRYFIWFLALGMAVLLGDLQGFVVQAGTISGGTAITLGGLDSFANTMQTYAKGNLGKMVGMIIAMAGIAGMAFQKIAMGLCALGAGVAIAFVPNIIGTAFDTTAAATLTPAAPFDAMLLAERWTLQPAGAGRADGPVAFHAGGQVRARPRGVGGAGHGGPDAAGVGAGVVEEPGRKAEGP